MSMMFSSKSSGGAPPAWRLPWEVVAERLAMPAIVPPAGVISCATEAAWRGDYERIAGSGAGPMVRRRAASRASGGSRGPGGKHPSGCRQAAVHEDHLPGDV